LFEHFFFAVFSPLKNASSDSLTRLLAGNVEQKDEQVHQKGERVQNILKKKSRFKI
jgi:hypothetical protein